MTEQAFTEQAAQYDREGIYTLLARYAHSFDAGDIDTWVSLFTDDGALITPNVGDAKGHSELRDWAEQRMAQQAGYQMRHHISNVLIAEITAQQASVSCYLTLTRQALDMQSAVELIAAAVYHDRLVYTADGWKFRQRSITL